MTLIAVAEAGSTETCGNCAYVDTDHVDGDVWGYCGALGPDALHYRRTGETRWTPVARDMTCSEHIDR